MTGGYKYLRKVIGNQHKTILRFPGVTLRYLLDPNPGIGHIYSNYTSLPISSWKGENLFSQSVAIIGLLSIFPEDCSRSWASLNT